jgi:hypothetical protein
MDSFTKVILIVRIVFVEFLLMMTWPGLVANLIIDVNENNVSKDLSYLISAFLIGAFCMLWLIRTMTKPSKRKGEGVIWSTLDRYKISDFPSTHPWYIFIDAILFLWVFALGEFEDNSVLAIWRYNALFAIAVFIPLLRLVCWYILGLKWPADQCIRAWKPVMWFWIIAGPFVLGIFILG